MRIPQLALRLRADHVGTALLLRMPGFPWLTGLGLLILAAIFTVGFIGEDSRPQLLSMSAVVALLAVACWLNYRNRKIPVVGEAPDGAKSPVLVD